MKTIFLSLLIFLLSFQTYGQALTLDSISGEYQMVEVINLDSSMTQKMLYDRCKEWIVRNLKSSDHNNNLSDPNYKQLTATGNLVAKNIVSFPIAYVDCSINFKITIDIKDSKIRYTIENIIHNSTMNGGHSPMRVTKSIEQLKQKNKVDAKMLVDINEKLDALVSDLKQFLKQSQKKGDSW